MYILAIFMVMPLTRQVYKIIPFSVNSTKLVLWNGILKQWNGQNRCVIGKPLLADICAANWEVMQFYS